MPNKNYIKGVLKERKIMNVARDSGLIAFRSAGSHSPIDVVIIDSKNKILKLIQCKTGNYTDNQKKKLQESLNYLDGEYAVRFYVE